MPQTRSQKDMQRALELVSSLERADPEVKRIYGGLCHSFPVMVMQSGLCQAVAFSADKARGQVMRAKLPAYERTGSNNRRASVRVSSPVCSSEPNT